MIKIIFQNKDFVVADKPAGIAVHAGVNIDEPTLVDFLIQKFPEIGNVGDAPEIRPGIVHRLDKETSGVMVIARNQKSFEHLKDLFKNRKVEKKYLALVHGKLPAPKGRGLASGGKNKTGKIEGEMGRSRRDFRRQSLVRGKISVRKERYSLTYYKLIKESRDYSLLEVYPATGRMHQIRVHLHSIGHPIVGDEKYTFKKYKKQKYPRMFLHASEISFAAPGGEKLAFRADIPKEFKPFLD